MKKINPKLDEQLKTLISSLGYDVVGCALITGGRQILRIYIDKEKGVTVDDCSKVSNQVSAFLDVENPISGSYALEVSSPGINKPLFEIEHYEKYVGEPVKIRLSLPINQRRQYKGILKRVVGENIYLLVDGMEQEVILPFSSIEKANLSRG